MNSEDRPKGHNNPLTRRVSDDPAISFDALISQLEAKKEKIQKAIDTLKELGVM